MMEKISDQRATSVRLPSAMREWLDQRARAEQRSVNSMIRVILDAERQRQQAGVKSGKTTA